jgi:pyruvate formate lyase activating enzyme
MSTPEDRRHVLKTWIMGGCALAWGGCTLHRLLSEPPRGGMRVGFRNDAPEILGPHAREAAWYAREGSLLRCQLCPHDCILGDDDRGFCRTRVVKDGRLHTLAYGNPCAAHVDPVEKKPLHHFLAGSSILSIATAGCNLRCLNCQNWEISQARPEDTRNHALWPERLVEICRERNIPSIAYTYSEPIIFYEYVRDTALQARERGVRNVLVTAGYIHEAPLREICRVVDAANVDLKAFNDRFYRKIAGARLAPVLRALEVMREEGVWIEVTRLLVPTWSDDLDDVRAMCRWMVRHLGGHTPLHLSRFRPDYKLQGLPPTPVAVLDRAGEIAREEGLDFVYIGNVPGHERAGTICPRCGLEVIERRGYDIPKMLLQDGCCPCGAPIPGVWT